VAASGGLQTAAGGAITSAGTIQTAHVINAQTGTSYAIVTSDRGKHVTLSNAASIAATIAQAGATGFEDGWSTLVECIGVGALTITPTTSTINGASTLVLDSGMAAWIYSDGANYRAVVIDRAGVIANAQTGTSYTYLSGDRGKLVTHSNASAIAGALPQATGAFGSGWFAWVQNRGAGTLTITPTTSTIDGSATLALTTGQGALIVSDGTNYYTMRGVGSSGGGGLTNWTDSLNSASPNGTTPVAALTATNAASNVDAAIIPKGNGALTAQIADGTSTGGNKRGTQAIDWQIYRTAAADVASGSRSFIGGGGQNRASGSYSVVAGGNINLAISDYSFVGGGYSNSAQTSYSTIAGGSANLTNATYASVLGGYNNSVTGQWGSCVGGRDCSISGLVSIGGGWGAKTINDYCAVYSAGNFAAIGDAQNVSMVLRAQTTNATQTSLTADQSSPATGNQLTLADNSAMTVKGLVTSRQNTTGDTATWEFTCAIKRGSGAGATAMVAACTPTAVAADSGASAWALSVTADTTRGALSIKFTGEASKTIRSVCRLEAVYVQG
jgi:hypothetical protein